MNMSNLTPAYSFTPVEIGILGACLASTVSYAEKYGIQSQETVWALENPQALMGLMKKLREIMEATMA